MKRRGTSGIQLSFDLAGATTSRDTEREAALLPEAPGSPEPPGAPPARVEASQPVIHSVAAITRKIKSLLEGGFGMVWVKGEVSNHRQQASGHHYFTLKDDTASLACVLFSGDARLHRDLRIADGLSVCLCGEITVYERRGNYQMVVRLVQVGGEGELQAKFEALKKRLDAEGLFAQARKRPLPRFPRRVGVVTSPTGAALQDFLQILRRRNPHICVVLAPARVQGKGAAVELAEALKNLALLTEEDRPEVVVVTRGGGSMEDLWEFNEEVLARAISECPIPVVSAVGHEIDFTIADFAADFRAPTPSAAAEILSAEADAVKNLLRQRSRELHRLCMQEVRTCGLHLDRIMVSFRRPERLLREFTLEIDRASRLLVERFAERHRQLASSLERARSAVRSHHPLLQLDHLRMRIKTLSSRQTAAVRSSFRNSREALAAREKLLVALDPGATLRRGFTLTYDSEGRLLKSLVDAQNVTELHTKFFDGVVISKAQTEKN